LGVQSVVGPYGFFNIFNIHEQGAGFTEPNNPIKRNQMNMKVLFVIFAVKTTKKFLSVWCV